MWNIIHFDEITSTQTYAKENKLPVYTIITAKHQTAGVGQYGRVWEDQGKSVMLTAVLPLPKLPVALFTQYVALNIIEQLSVYREDIQIKWPNDLVIGRKKLGGILTEVSGDVVYLGVGVNIVQTGIAVACGLVDRCTEIQYQKMQEHVIQAIQTPVAEDYKKLKQIHAYCVNGVCIGGKHYLDVEITAQGALKVRGKEYISSEALDVFYEHQR